MSDFRRELAALLNRHSKESASDTPDFLLADYLVSCLETYNRTVTARARWYAPPTLDSEATVRPAPPGPPNPPNPTWNRPFG